MTFFVILVVIVIAIAVSDSAKKKTREEEERQEAQKAKTDVAAAVPSICRMLEALDILEDRIKWRDEDLNFFHHIGISIQTHDSVFQVKCFIINSNENPSVQKDLDSISREQALRATAKKLGETLPTKNRGPDNYTVWCSLTDEQFDIVSDMITGLDQERNKDDDIVLKGDLPLRFDNPSDYDSYTHKANVYVRALTEAIHAKCPEYGLEANSYGIHFTGKNGVVSYDGI